MIESLNNEAIVKTLYAVMLQRHADQSGLDSHVRSMENEGFSKVLENFMESVEFKSRINATAMKLTNDVNFKSSMSVDWTADSDTLDRIWRHIASVWEGFGRDDALWSVLTDERFRKSNTPSDETVKEFYASGAGDIEFMSAFLRRAQISISGLNTALEYGCGVGRVTRWLSELFPNVIACDISQNHLDVAKENLRAAPRRNVIFEKIKSRGDVCSLQNFDMFFSLIVLQHNPPPIICDILIQVFDKINSGGLAFFQVPTFKEGYRFDCNDYLANEVFERKMEMHFVPQKAIFTIAKNAGMKLLEVRSDHCIGNSFEQVSNTFLMQKT